MQKLTRNDLYTLEKYAEIREDFRKKVMIHKADRRLNIGENAALYFEDRLTIQYQVQEMLRAEKIFEADAIQEELDTYNPLIPSDAQWKATFMIEFGDETERRAALERMKGIENNIWLQVEGHERIFAIADEDMERSNEEKTSAVHFLRFRLDPKMVTALEQGNNLSAGIEHPAYTFTVSPIPENIKQALLRDLD